MRPSVPMRRRTKVFDEPSSSMIICRSVFLINEFFRENCVSRLGCRHSGEHSESGTRTQQKVCVWCVFDILLVWIKHCVYNQWRDTVYKLNQLVLALHDISISTMLRNHLLTGAWGQHPL
jgi:hypothetical protein